MALVGPVTVMYCSFFLGREGSNFIWDGIHFDTLVLCSSSVSLKLLTQPKCKSAYLCINMNFVKLEHQSIIRILRRRTGPKIIHKHVLAVL
jgi:hypothetical protein